MKFEYMVTTFLNDECICTDGELITNVPVSKGDSITFDPKDLIDELKDLEFIVSAIHHQENIGTTLMVVPCREYKE